MTLEELSNEELLEVFKSASLDLALGGAKVRSYYYEVKEELLNDWEVEPNE